jgi:hypothetical protein
MRCAKCSSDNPPGKRFCGDCGAQGAAQIGAKMHAKNVFPESPVGSQSVGHSKALELSRFTIARSSALMSLGKLGKNTKTRSRQRTLDAMKPKGLLDPSRWVALIDQPPITGIYLLTASPL